MLPTAAEPGSRSTTVERIERESHRLYERRNDGVSEAENLEI
jgi:hypothetical protein